MIGTIARVTLLRLGRGRALWVGGLILVMPVLFAVAMRAAPDFSETDVRQTLFATMTLVLSVLPALFVASAVGEDIEDRTVSYLWARPVPRHAVLLGKLLALAPLLAIGITTSWAIANLAGPPTEPPAGSFVGIALGALAASCIAATLGTIVPRHGMAVTVCYLLFFDLLLGAMPVSLANLAVSHHARGLAFADTITLAPILWLLGLGAAWLLFGVRRIRRLEA